MELPFSIFCPKCSVRLQIKDEAVLGQTMKCPKCGESFTAALPAEAGEDIYGIASDPKAEAPPELPPPLPKKPAKPKADDEGARSKKAKKKSKAPQRRSLEEYAG